MLVVGNCQRLVAVCDLNGDGIINRLDFIQGTGLGVDVNGDHLIWGRGERLSEGSVFEVCGKRWELAAFAPRAEWIEYANRNCQRFVWVNLCRCLL
jgi:hypothetical protein